MPSVLPLDDERLLSHLAEGEEPRVFVRQHPLILIRPAAQALGVTVVWLWVAGRVPAGRILDLLLLVVVLLWLRLGYCELERRFNFIGVTDKRIFKTEGLITRRYPAMRINKVTDVTLVRTLPGVVFRYSKIIIESAGQEQALHDLDYLPSPEATDLLWAELFGSRPRARKDRRRRLPLPGLRRRRGDEDDEGDEGDDWGGPRDDGGPEDPPAPPPPGQNAGGRPAVHRSPVREGDPRGNRLLDEDDTDVPAAGDWRAHPYPSGLARGRRIGIPGDGESIYTSADLRPRTSHSADTGPIPISTRRTER